MASKKPEQKSESALLSKKENVNKGHRSRLRKRFLMQGLDQFEPHQVLELLLFYSLPRVDTNPIAHRLLNQFHTISGVLDADPKDLMQVQGVNEQTAVFLHMLPNLCKRYYLEKELETSPIVSYSTIKDYLRIQFLDAVEEKAMIICFDDNLKMLGSAELSSGSVNTVAISTQKLAETAMRMHSRYVLLAHNHPVGDPTPSDSDVFTTRQIFTGLRYLDIQLIDHIIVGKHQTLSMRESGLWQTVTY